MKVPPALHRANRASARIALYSSLTLTLLLGAAFVGGLRSLEDGPLGEIGWEPGRRYEKEPAVVQLRDYIRIDTTPQTGSELAGAEYLAAILAREGIASEIIDMGERKANLIAVLEGDSDEAIVLHNHIDVDPILEPEKWEFPPFSGQIYPPWIYGRGAFDMKSVAIAQLQAMIELKHSGVRPQRSVIFLATSGEETGSLQGTAWLLRERADLLGRSWGVLTEGGVVEARTTTDIKYWGTETAQKRVVRLLACSPSKERLTTLRDDLRASGQSLENLRLSAPVAEFLRYYASSRDNPAHRDFLTEPDVLLDDLERFRQLPLYLQGLFRDEIAAFPAERDADGHGYVMRITVGLLPDTDLEGALTRLLPDWMTQGIRIVPMTDDGPPHPSPIDHPIFSGIRKLVESRYGAVPTGPYFQSRSTNDSRLFRQYGIPSYGFSPFLVLSTDTVGIGGTDEKLALPAFVNGVDLYVELLRQLVTPT